MILHTNSKITILMQFLDLAGTEYIIVPLEIQEAIIRVVFLDTTSNKKLALKLLHYILSKPKAFDMLIQR